MAYTRHSIYAVAHKKMHDYMAAKIWYLKMHGFYWATLYMQYVIIMPST